MARRIFAVRPTLPKLPFGFADVALFFGLFLLIYAVAHVGAGLFVEFRPPKVLPQVDLDPANLPYYAARSTLRMFIALGAALVFSIAYGYAAARNKRAEQLLVPILDMLQSVPVLAFLTITVSAFIGLFPGSLFGLELASIFAVFTAQAWNMTFSFYHSMITLPRDLDEAAQVFGLSKWRRFVSVELPSSMIGLVWNAMMSFGGGWFFIAASEAILVFKRQVTLPGIGSYVVKAIDERNLPALGYASLAMVIVIVMVDQLFWRPLVAWSEKFKLERSASSDPPTSWVLDLIRDAKLPRTLNRVYRRFLLRWRRVKWPKLRLHLRWPKLRARTGAKRKPFINGDLIFGAVLGALVVGALWVGTRFVTQEVALREVGSCFWLGFITFLRVAALLVVATVVWTPVGVAIGFNPRLARVAQPVVQIMASYPSNFLFPLVTLLLLRMHGSLNWGAIVLMALGAQWYITFNCIAGAMAVPTDLREMASNMGLRGPALWKKLILPAIFPAWITGAVTASGGAWNASILAEVVEWGNHKLVATGLGAYLTQAHDANDIPRVVLAVSVMCVFVVGINRFVWRKLYTLAETRYRLA
ncbi:MAG: ABC transporter permease subunit [Fimbriimonas ginsengisoli]|uniref:ABC transporter permease subunit n=1 Tax=Fimbriimonas ginsengisoli TaxID=1005039 RepID=A0A931PUV1_FIMGI|nr:ABC transporter permease subunit [Fimbriimonas ginsengisoli]